MLTHFKNTFSSSLPFSTSFASTSSVLYFFLITLVVLSLKYKKNIISGTEKQGKNQAKYKIKEINVAIKF